MRTGSDASPPPNGSNCDDPIHREAAPRELLMIGLALALLAFCAAKLHQIERGDGSQVGAGLEA